MNKFFLILGILIFALFVAWLVRNYLPQRNSQGVDAGEDSKLVTNLPALDSPESPIQNGQQVVGDSAEPVVEPTPVDQEPDQIEAATDTEMKLPFQVQLVYSPGYLINLGGLERLHPFDIKKYQRIHDQLVAEGLISKEQTLQPSSLTVEELKLIHSDQ